MHLSMVTFNFQSADIDAEESHYLDYHVGLARRFPGVRQYYTGRLMKAGGKQPDRFRAGVYWFDDAAAAAAAMSSEVVPALMTDSMEHLKDLTSIAADAEMIVPFDSRRVGQSCFVMCAQFDLEQAAGADAAEKHYREAHVGIARRLPGLRNYVIGKLLGPSADGQSRYRIAMLVFDSLDAYRAAYQSPAGAELLKDEAATIRNAHVYRLDGRVEV